ncbi:MAG: hypothetical protein PHI23_02365 [Candidatus Peribacteraceae bacterium]|nr:hypothetical protein [Candidatus Peribacteraceae bacterium]
MSAEVHLRDLKADNAKDREHLGWCPLAAGNNSLLQISQAETGGEARALLSCQHVDQDNGDCRHTGGPYHCPIKGLKAVTLQGERVLLEVQRKEVAAK